MKIRLSILLSLCCTLCIAAVPVTPDQAETYFTVEAEGLRVSLGGMRPANATPMEIKIVGPGGKLILDDFSSNQWVDFDITETTPDGVYHYEVIYLVPVPDSLEQNERGDWLETHDIIRTNGFFQLENGVLYHPEAPAVQIQRNHPIHPNADTQTNNLFFHGIAWLLDQLTPSAQAASLTADGTVPTVFFDDTQDENCSPNGDWWLTGDGGDSDSDPNNIFRLWVAPDPTGGCAPGGTSSSEVISIRANSASTLSSISVSSNGNVGLASSTLFVDKANGRVGIGTTAPAQELEIQGGTPRIVFDESSTSLADYMIGEIGGDFAFNIISNGTGGPVAEVMTIDGQTGHVGIHDVSPDAPLTVSGPGDSTKILVDNLAFTAATRTLLELRNRGNTKFSINNTDKNVEWAFTNSGGGFRISRQGSGVVEFDLLNNGNLTIAGTLTENSDRNEKTHIVEIDSDDILQKIINLPIQQWQYKDAIGENHIGPMAQDFYAAFGLGGTDKGIATLDSSGVALAAIQALAKQNEILSQQNQQLVTEVANLQENADRTKQLEAALQAQQVQLKRLEALITQPPVLIALDETAPTKEQQL